MKKIMNWCNDNIHVVIVAAAMVVLLLAGAS